LHDVVLLGELGLGGRVRAIRGVLPAVIAAMHSDIRRVVVPLRPRAEAAHVPGVDVAAAPLAPRPEPLPRGHPPRAELAPSLPGAHRARPAAQAPSNPAPGGSPPSAACHPTEVLDVDRQQGARHGIEMCAAGGRHLLLYGPPGVAKLTLAAQQPGLLPPLARP